MTAKRIAVFLDYQNVYRGARRAFDLTADPHMAGQIFPRRLGLKIAGVGDPERELSAVHVYRGLPSSAEDPRGFGAAQRQVGVWSNQALVYPHVRPLNYGDPSRPREKGVDVMLALGCVMGAMKDDFDICVIFSADTDLVPALESVVAIKGPDACEVACRQPSDGSSPSRLRVSNHHIRCHKLTITDYNHVRDTQDYTIRPRRR